MKYLFVTTLAFLFIGTASQACSCKEWSSAKKMLDGSAAAFLVIPSSDSAIAGTDAGHTVLNTKFSIVRNYKGVNQKEVVLNSIENDGGNCGASFQKDSGIYLVFAFEHEGKLHINECNYEIVFEENTKLLAMLRELNSL